MEVASQANALTSATPTLLLRPESLRVKHSSETEIGDGVGRVLNVIFYGAHVEYLIKSANGELTAVVSDPTYDEIVPVGHMAEFSFDPKRAWLLPSTN
jgi:hypothetical protein